MPEVLPFPCLLHVANMKYQANTGLTGVAHAAGLLFFELLFLSFRSLFLALFTFPEEFKMLLKERASGMYQLSAFFFARTFSGEY